MQGIFIAGIRPASKKAVRGYVRVAPADVRLEATSMFGNEYDGPVADAPDGEYHFVGPDPYTSRRFYGTLTVRDGNATVK